MSLLNVDKKNEPDKEAECQLQKKQQLKNKSGMECDANNDALKAELNEHLDVECWPSLK